MYEENMTMTPEIRERFDHMDDNFGKVFDLIRDLSNRFGAHKMAEIQTRTAHAGRIVALEEAMAARRGWTGNVILAGIAAAFGAVAGYFHDFFKGKS